jgi:hypothetical protein
MPAVGTSTGPLKAGVLNFVCKPEQRGHADERGRQPETRLDRIGVAWGSAFDIVHLMSGG